MKLMLLIIPTIQKIVKPAANGAAERDDVAAERVRDERDVDPEGDREDAEADLAGELPAGAEVEEVVDRAERGRRGAADQQRGQLAGEGRAQRLVDPERQEPAEVVGRDEDQRRRR